MGCDMQKTQDATILAVSKKLTLEQQLRIIESVGNQWNKPLSVWKETTFPVKKEKKKVAEPIKPVNKKK